MHHLEHAPLADGDARRRGRAERRIAERRIAVPAPVRRHQQGSGHRVAARKNRCLYRHVPGSSQRNSERHDEVSDPFDPSNGSTVTHSEPVSGDRAVNARVFLGMFAMAILVALAPSLTIPPLGHSRSSTIAFSVVVGTMNALRSPRNTSSACVGALDSSCGEMEACVMLRTGASDGRAPSRSAAAASTSLPSRSGHRMETVVSPSSGANTFSTSMSAPSETSKNALDAIAARALRSCVEKAAAGWR